MRKKKAGATAVKSFALLVVLATANQAMAQDAKAPYPNMAPVEQYLMDRAAEIALARTIAITAIATSTIRAAMATHSSVSWPS